ncbi:acidic mammalian chitinase-like [Physella acuta]|uniref:acidic mammalian chitinase-like n=1 Tax=Physella acuta TaxID=109671 RepID=UPI0027DDBE20|nr:acidic mammalian chitinase-like [Physella acuta]XP_059156771.1 acidic mammalian chitinase-like [Physella acuta]XP_059156772.1 acidic mammalian chitinase-like [Physella acuta]XP_059156773.1 acidic mammalian chitinase-like [Physella acuta]
MLLTPTLILLVATSVASLRSVCYYTNWAQYRAGKGKFLPENVDPTLCTHILYAFAKPEGTEIKPFEWNDDDMYSRIMALKNRNGNLKVLLSLGGGSVGSAPFTHIVHDPSTRGAFITSAINYLRQKHFDGLDVDWEYPAQFESPASDKQKFLQFMQELKSRFESEASSSGRPRLLLTGAFPADKSYIDAGYDVAGLAAVMDFINVMTYDFHGPWGNTVGFNSPLYAHPSETGWNSQLNLDWTMKYYVSKGAPKDKLNIGIGTYARTFRLADSNQHNIGAPSGGEGTAGPVTQSAGTLAYYEVCDLISSGASPIFDSSQRNPYIVRGSDWIGYDNQQSVKEKACYARNNGYGVMFWELSMDDFSGQSCGQGNYPLIGLAYRVVQGSEGCP